MVILSRDFIKHIGNENILDKETVSDCMNITIQDIEILIQCKKLVEVLLKEKQWTLEYLQDKGDDRVIPAIKKQIARMECALEGKSFY